MSGRPTTPDWVAAAQCSWRGQANQSSTLHGYGAPFLVFSLPTQPVECEELTKGVFYWWGGSKAGRAAERFKPQPSVTVGERSKGRLTTTLGQTGAAWNVEQWCQVDGARGASYAAWR
jgi:hypothetical protein